MNPHELAPLQTSAKNVAQDQYQAAKEISRKIESKPLETLFWVTKKLDGLSFRLSIYVVEGEERLPHVDLWLPKGMNFHKINKWIK